MNRRNALLILVAALLVGTATAWAVTPQSKTTAAAQRAAKQSEEIEKRIDALLKQRLKPDPLPRVPPNPFVVVSGVVTPQRDDTADAAPDAPPAETPSATPTADEFPAFTNAELLARCAVLLKFGGMIQLNDRVQIVINNVPRKEGDIVSVTIGNQKVYLRVAKISPGAVTMRLNDAEQVITF